MTGMCTIMQHWSATTQNAVKTVAACAAALLATAFNSVVLFFLSLLAAGGDGSDDLVRLVWLFGYLWIAIFLLASLVFCVRGKRRIGMAVSVMTLPAGYVLALIGVLVNAGWTSLRPNSADFELACQSAGARYLAKPSAGVESIAYDWEAGTYPPQINYFAMGARGNVFGSRGGLPQFPPSIKFTEGRCCQFEGGPRNGVRP